VKLHFAINTMTHEVVAMTVFTNDVHDSKAVPGLLVEAEGKARVEKMIGDGA
jgi:hypothetical protein